MRFLLRNNAVTMSFRCSPLSAFQGNTLGEFSSIRLTANGFADLFVDFLINVKIKGASMHYHVRLEGSEALRNLHGDHDGVSPRLQPISSSLPHLQDKEHCATTFTPSVLL